MVCLSEWRVVPRRLLTRGRAVPMVRAALRAARCCIVPIMGASVEQMDAREQGDREQPPNDEAALTARFRRLGEQRVHPEAVSQQSQGEPPAADATAIARGFRLSSELV